MDKLEKVKSQKLQQKRIDDEEIMKFEEAREQKLVDNLPKFYQMLDEIMKDNENGTIKKVKILQNGQDVDAYINIAEDIKAKAYGETHETVNMTVYAEFFNENHEPLEGVQIVKEYEGERDIDEIVWKINEDRLNDEEIMLYEDEKYEELQRTLPLIYKELYKMIKQGEANE